MLTRLYGQVLASLRYPNLSLSCKFGQDLFQGLNGIHISDHAACLLNCLTGGKAREASPKQNP